MRNLVVPPIVVPAILLIAIVAYGLLRAPDPSPIALRFGAPSTTSPR